MPIEIKELTIKAYIDDASKPQTPPQTPESSGNNSTEMIIAACVEQVLQVLKDRGER